MSSEVSDAVVLQGIQRLIFEVQKQKVILDHHLAAIYGVETRTLNQAVKRNSERFPEDFCFRLTKGDVEALDTQVLISNAANRSQFVIGSQKHRDPKYLPFAFTEHGALMAANVLRSPTAIQMSVFIVRAFVRMREELSSRSDMERRLDQIESILLVHDNQLKELFEKIRPLLLPPPDPPKRRVGFGVRESKNHSKKS